MFTVCAICFMSLLTYDGTLAMERGIITFGALAMSSFCLPRIIVFKVNHCYKL
jgi:hypothetical protein